KDVEMEMGFLDANNPLIPPSLTSFEWSFGDGSANSNELFPQHAYEEEGGKTIELYLKNINACTDTIRQSIIVQPDPIIIQQPESIECLVGDDILFSVIAQSVDSYQWYAQDGSGNEWLKLSENVHYSGVTTRELTVSNVRPAYDGYNLKCIVEGYCGLLSNSSSAEINIVDNPARVLLSLSRNEICIPDTAILHLTIKEIYLLQSAQMNITYDPSDIEILDYQIFLNEESIDVTINEDHIIINYHISTPIFSDELILVSFTVKSKVMEAITHDFGWNEDDMYFNSIYGEPISHLLYGTQLNMHQPIINSFNDTISLCHGSKLELDEELFRFYNWSSGDNTSSMKIEDRGLYWVDLIDTNYCHSVDTFYIIPLEIPDAPKQININQTYYCAYDDEILFSVETDIENGISLSYLDETIIDSLNDFYDYTISNPGYDFEITAATFNSCGQSEFVTAMVQVLPAAEPSVSIISDTNCKSDIHLGELVFFKAEFMGGGENPNFTWWIDDLVKQNGSADIFATNELKAIQNIKLELFSDAKCLQNDNYAITQIEFRLENAEEVFAPTIITPNGNSLNSAFKVIFRDDNIYNFHLQIYNINGQRVFSTKNRYEYWSGYDVQNSSAGMYTYRFQYSLELKPIGNQLKVLQGKFLLHK
ncbi:MAG: gliding motility-associated C-terminal domain-containing protein, partial [Bacteroidales bacterium]|nr:gliding motility-associated C-terminal domain-containing protein [Bacteroidales bacterium]